MVDRGCRYFCCCCCCWWCYWWWWCCCWYFFDLNYQNWCYWTLTIWCDEYSSTFVPMLLSIAYILSQRSFRCYFEFPFCLLCAAKHHNSAVHGCTFVNLCVWVNLRHAPVFVAKATVCNSINSMCIRLYVCLCMYEMPILQYCLHMYVPETHCNLCLLLSIFFNLIYFFIFITLFVLWVFFPIQFTYFIETSRFYLVFMIFNVNCCNFFDLFFSFTNSCEESQSLLMTWILKI